VTLECCTGCTRAFRRSEATRAVELTPEDAGPLPKETQGRWHHQLDLKQGIVGLDPGGTKNNEGRTIYLNEGLMGMMHSPHAQRRLGCPYVFHQEGMPIQNFGKSWNSACKVGGLWGFDEKKGRYAPTRIFHGFRRTAVRDMVRATIPERVVMMMSGHKTRRVFKRYNIVTTRI